MKNARSIGYTQIKDLTGKLGLGPYSREKFLERLNATEPGQMSENLSHVFEIIDELNAPKNSHRSQSRKSGPASRVDELIRELNRRMRRHMILPQFWFQRGRLSLTWAQYVTGQTFGPGGSFCEGDLLLVPLLQDALTSGDLPKLKRCEWPKCKKWFFRKRQTQDFHNMACYEKGYKSMPKFKRKRAIYMRKLRKLKKSGKVK